MISNEKYLNFVFELQSCRSRRGLKFYKKYYLLSSLNKKVMIFLKTYVPIVQGETTPNRRFK
jgi:hypothetical protein